MKLENQFLRENIGLIFRLIGMNINSGLSGVVVTFESRQEVG